MGSKATNSLCKITIPQFQNEKNIKTRLKKIERANEQKNHSIINRQQGQTNIVIENHHNIKRLDRGINNPT